MISLIEEEKLQLIAGGKIEVPTPRPPLLPRKPPPIGIPAPRPPGMPCPYPAAE
jgi:hypothetical protein